MRFQAPDAAALGSCDLVFFATPSGVAMQLARQLLDRQVRIIDLSADFRLREPAAWEHWYGAPHSCPELLDAAVYGLPELHREAIRDAQLVAAPGCYPTAICLGFLPLVSQGHADPTRLVASAASGLSGAGRQQRADLLLVEASDSMKAYGASGHRHLPEMLQLLETVCDTPVSLQFIPHLAPMIRGMHATLCAETPLSREQLQELYEDYYAAAPFVDVLPAGAHPATRDVRGTNLCRIAVHVAPAAKQARAEGVGGRKKTVRNRATILAVLDNLVKGAAGQAVQCMNLMLGLAEDTGLPRAAMVP